MDAICPSAPQVQAPSGIRESTVPVPIPTPTAPQALEPSSPSGLVPMAPHNNPRAKGASNLSPLRTFGPAGRQPSHP